jgi:tetratricopeptide (TPR) repeat protein
VRQRLAIAGLPAALLAAAIGLAEPPQPARAPIAAMAVLAQAPAPPSGPALGQSLSQANAALQAGEADKALVLLGSVLASGPPSGVNLAQGHNLICRVRLTLEEWQAAATECEQAARLDAQNSDFHLWLGRALGETADRASFLTAYSLAKRTRAEFEESVRLNPRNAEALADLGDFYRQAPGVVGGGIDKAEEIASQLDKVDAARAHQLRGHIAEQQKDYVAAERELKQAIAANAHPALSWTNLAGFYAHRKRFEEMESAIHSAAGAALHDKQAAVSLYDGAGLLIGSNRNPALAASLLEDYLASSSKTEDAPAFIAHIRLARLKVKLGDAAAADRERSAALALAHDYKPAQEFKAQSGSQPKDATQQLARF